jgi:hypothetical protein
MAIDVALRVDPERGERWLRGHVAVVERDGTLWEVLDDAGRPYRGRLGLWRADEAMLWAALFLDVLRRPPARAMPGGS